MSLQCAANNPFRPADWRWQRAVAITDNTPEATPPSRRLDGGDGFRWITAAERFQREYQACINEEQRANLAEKRPALFWAHWAYRSSNMVKHIIESQILARSDDYAIGFRCNMPPEYIATYEALFFNVREKLHHRSYILNCVLGPTIHKGLTDREPELLWKLYGYFIGPCIIDALEGKFTNPVWCSTPETVSSAIMDDAIGSLKMKAAIAAKTIQVNQYTQLAILDTFTKFVEIERNTDSAGKAQEQILNHISAMMTTLPFNVGGRSTKGMNRQLSAPVDAFDKTAIELTYEETLRLSVRQPIAHQDILRSLSFPVNEATQLIGSNQQ